ncbi:MAG: hypothetical protein IJ225_07860 [Solobacterium sp.]|nr:hypothetical protein [Solobacterium sp.]
MRNLSEISSGITCKVVWLIGFLGRSIRESALFEEESLLSMIFNLGEYGVIVCCNGKRIAMDAQSARAVKVTLELS